MSAVPGLQPTPTDPGVELLERALAYTQGALAIITPAHLGLRTPCPQWRLVDLLAHMEDSLDAFAEGAKGVISLHSGAPAPVGDQIAALQTKACHLLGAWASATTPLVEVGGHPVPVGTISRLAALEIATHGWDVGRATGYDAALPDELAEGLLATALAVALEQHGEFGPPVAVSLDAGPARRLLGLLGRRGS